MKNSAMSATMLDYRFPIMNLSCITDDDRPASTSNRGGQRMELFTVNNLPLHISEAKLKEMFPRALSVVIKVDRDGWVDFLVLEIQI